MGRSNRSVTISDVAHEAGVSTATVSHVLNKTRYVSDELCEQVQAAVKKLGYYPNKLIGSLRTKKSYTIGLILPSSSNETLGLLAERIQKLLFEHGYNLIICNTSYDAEIEARALETLIMKQSDAIIAIPVGEASSKLHEIVSLGIPLVLADRKIKGLRADSAVVDNRHGAFEAVEYLISNGHRNIGYIDRKTAQSHSIDQRQGYLEALQAHGITPPHSYIVSASGYSYEAGYDAAKHLMDKNPEITAIFAYYDVAALGAVRADYDRGKRVPEDMSIIGYDGMPFSQFTQPRLSTVLFPVEQLAQSVCKLVISRLQSEEGAESRAIIITPHLIQGESVGPVPSAAPGK